MSYAHDANGNLTGLKPPGRETHGFTPTAVNLLGAYTPPELGQGPTTTNYQYNLDRQLQDVLRPTGDSVHVEYDGAGRLWKVGQRRGTSTVSYSPSTGQVQSVTSPDSVVLSYGYNGSLPTSETWSGAVTGSVSREFNPELLPESETVTVGASTSTVGYAYDEDGLLTQVDLPGGVSYAIARLPESGSSEDNGQVDSTQVGDVVEGRDYNSHGELVNLRYRHGTTVLLQQSLTRDLLGRVTHLTETAGGTTQEVAYGYDAAGRLQTVTVVGDAAASRVYVYDDSLPGNGNRTAEKDGNGAVLARPGYDGQDRLLTYGSASYQYTLAGELTRRATAVDTLSTEYDALGSLVRVGWKEASTAGPGSPIMVGTTYTYQVDGQNRRVRKLLEGEPVRGWLYADALHPVAELDGTGALLNRYVYATRSHVPDLLLRGGVVYRMVTDHLGSVRAVVDVTTGAPAQRLDYDAWGVLTLDTAPTFQSLGYAGGIHDRDTRLVRFGARDYEPTSGRWTSKDPKQVSEFSTNATTYCDSDPLNYLDIDGAARVKNYSGTPVVVEGGPGAGRGHEGGPDLFGVVPPDKQEYGGAGRPVSGYLDPNKAKRAAQGLATNCPPNGLIQDIDDWLDERGARHHVRGDDIGPTYVITRDKDGKLRTNVNPFEYAGHMGRIAAQERWRDLTSRGKRRH